MKNTMLGELMENSGPLKDEAFYANKIGRSLSRAGVGSLKERLISIKQQNEPPALARKYAAKWLKNV